MATHRAGSSLLFSPRLSGTSQPQAFFTALETSLGPYIPFLRMDGNTDTDSI